MKANLPASQDAEASTRVSEVQPADWPHTTTLESEVDGQPVLKEYRWRFEAGVDAHDQPRIVAQHRRLPAGGWSEVRSPDRLAQLRALASPV